MNFDLSFINIVLTVLGSVVAIAGTILFAFSKLTAEGRRASIESNGLLRNLIEDQRRELTKLRERMHETENTITALKLQVELLLDRRDYLEKVINTALREHFSADPSIAKKVQEILTSDEKK